MFDLGEIVEKIIAFFQTYGMIAFGGMGMLYLFLLTLGFFFDKENPESLAEFVMGFIGIIFLGISGIVIVIMIVAGVIALGIEAHEILFK